MRRLTALLAVALLASGGLAAGGGAQEVTPASIRLLDRTPWVGDGTDFVLTVQLLGVPVDSLVRLTVHGRVTSRTEFARSVLGEGLRGAVYRSTEVDLATADPDGDGVLRLGVPLVAQEGVAPAPITRSGVYPVELVVRSPGGDEVAVLRSHLVRLPAFDPEAEAVPLDAVVVLPIDAPPVHLGTAPPAAPDAPITELAAVLAQHAEVAVTVVPTPETVAGAASADPDAVAALRATLAGRQVLGGPWVGLDEAAWQRADGAELQRQLDRGRQTLEQELGVTVDDLRLAPAGSTEAQVQAMVAGGSGALVVNEIDLAPLDAGDFRFTLTRPFALAPEGVDRRTVPALAADASLAAAADGADTDPVLAAHLVLADLAVLASDQPALRRVATLVLPPDAARSPAFLDALLEGLEPPAAPPAPPASLDPAVPTPAPTPAAAPVVVARTASAALAEVEPAGATGEPDPDDPLVRTMASSTPPAAVSAVAREVDGARTHLGSYRAVFGPGDDLLEILDPLVATAPAARLGAADRRASLAGATALVDQQLAGLGAPSQQRVTLTAREGRIQLLLTNDTGRPADVVLLLRGDRLVLPEAPDGRLPVHLEGPTTRVDLQVEARSSGDAPLDVVLLTPDGRVELGQARITVRATAVSGVGVALLASSAAFLLVWWTRTIVRERRGARGRHPAHARGRHRRHPQAPKATT